MGTGEAVTSFLDGKGIPMIVERTLIRPPSSQLGPIDEPTRKAIMQASAMAGKYDTSLDRESAFEIRGATTEVNAADRLRADLLQLPGLVVRWPQLLQKN